VEGAPGCSSSPPLGPWRLRALAAFQMVGSLDCDTAPTALSKEYPCAKTLSRSSGTSPALETTRSAGHLADDPRSTAMEGHSRASSACACVQLLFGVPPDLAPRPKL
jgi:hypothetical protein